MPGPKRLPPWRRPSARDWPVPTREAGGSRSAPCTAFPPCHRNGGTA